MRDSALILTAVAATTLLAGNADAYPPGGDPIREIGRTTEKEINVVLTSSFGSVAVGRGEKEKMLVAETKNAETKDPMMGVNYNIRNRIGYLDIALGEGCSDENRSKGTFAVNSLRGGTWDLKFSDAVPISFDVELGVGSGDFDLTGLKVKDFNLHTGASDVTLDFDTPNEASIDNITVESGVSKFSGRNLNNANFKHFQFQGGVGSYELDFGGDLRGEVDVDIDLGFGFLTIIVPKSTGARVFYEKNWVSRLDCDRDFGNAAENQYVTDNFYTAGGKMNIRINSGLGSIRIRHR